MNQYLPETNLLEMDVFYAAFWMATGICSQCKTQINQDSFYVVGDQGIFCPLYQ